MAWIAAVRSLYK